MARVTVEDCIEKVPNRFQLVLFAAHRAREISSGAAASVLRENDKDPVVALREIAEDAVDPADLREKLVSHLQMARPKLSPNEDPDRPALTVRHELSEEQLAKVFQAEQEAAREERF